MFAAISGLIIGFENMMHLSDWWFLVGPVFHFNPINKMIVPTDLDKMGPGASTSDQMLDS